MCIDNNNMIYFNLGTLRFSCQFQVEGNHIVASSCQSEGFIPASFECQIDDQPKYTCKLSNTLNEI